MLLHTRQQLKMTLEDCANMGILMSTKITRHEKSGFTSTSLLTKGVDVAVSCNEQSFWDAGVGAFRGLI